MPAPTSMSSPRFGLRWRITLPFILLALGLSLGMVYLLGLTVNQEQQSRYLRQLTDSGQQAADAVVRLESDLLAVERLIANTEGMLSGVQQADSEALRAGTLPLVVNAGVDLVSILDAQGTSLLSVRRAPGGSAGEYSTLRGEGFYTSWPFVQRLLAGSSEPAIGDKQTGVHAVRIGEADVPVFFVGGPLRDAGGVLYGAVLVGHYLTNVVPELAAQAGASVSVYDQFDGRLLATSLEPDDPAAMTVPAETIEHAMAPRASGDPIRSLPVSGTEYTEVLTAFVARQGTEPLGVLGVSLPQVALAGQTSDDVLRVIGFSVAALILVVVTGLFISNSITRPIIAIADASAQVALGNLETRVAHQGSDELAVLARTFNQMIDDLQQRTLMDARSGPPVTLAPGQPEATPVAPPPPAAPTLAQPVGRSRGSVLALELRGFDEDEEAPEVLVRGLQECLAMVSAAVARHSGTLVRAGSTTMMALFGVPPAAAPPAVSALQATHTAMDILEGLQALNEARLDLGLGPLQAFVSVTTGDLVQGNLGAQGQSYTALLGDARSTAEGMLAIAREAGPASVLIGEETYRNLGPAQRQFIFGRFGRAQLRGVGREVGVHEVKDRVTRLVGPSAPDAWPPQG